MKMSRFPISRYTCDKGLILASVNGSPLGGRDDASDDASDDAVNESLTVKEAVATLVL